MGFWRNAGQRFKDFLFRDIDHEIVAIDTAETARLLAVRNLAYEMCVQRISRAIAKCPFKTFEDGKEVKGDWYYLLNVRPNKNQSAAEFWDKFIHSLYYHHEALIVMIGDCLYVADAFTASDDVIRARKFTGVQIESLTLSRTFTEANAFYFRLDNAALKSYLDETTGLCAQLMIAAEKSYKRANGAKYVMKVGRLPENKGDKEKDFKAVMNETLKSFITSDDAVWLEHQGTELRKIETGGSSGATADTRDIKALLDDVIEITCKAFLMPTNIMTGEVTDTSKAVDDFLTFCLDSVVELIQDGLNSKKFTKEEYLSGSRIKIDTLAIKHVDVLDMASAVEKLISSAVYSINEIRELIGEERIDEEWADMHFITKNFASLAALSSDWKGGSEDEENEIMPGVPDGA